jgi:hypothetical protein
MLVFNLSGNVRDLFNYVVEVGYELTLGDETLKVNQTTTSSGTQDDYTVSSTTKVKTSVTSPKYDPTSKVDECPDTLGMLKQLYPNLHI